MTETLEVKVMTTKKEAIGFQTPAKQIEEQFTAILEQLETKTKSWSKLEQETAVLAGNAQQAVESLRKQHRNVEANELLNLYLSCWILNYISTLGIELNEVHATLAKIEKKLA